jgi:hypothetical protein
MKTLYQSILSLLILMMSGLVFADSSGQDRNVNDIKIHDDNTQNNPASSQDEKSKKRETTRPAGDLKSPSGIDSNNPSGQNPRDTSIKN